MLCQRQHSVSQVFGIRPAPATGAGNHLSGIGRGKPTRDALSGRPGPKHKGLFPAILGDEVDPAIVVAGLDLGQLALDEIANRLL